MPRSKQTKQEKPKATAKKSSKKEEKVEVVKPVEVVVEKVVEPVEVDEVMLISKDFSNFLEKLQQVNTLLSSLKTEFRALEKKTAREFKVVQKQNAKRKRKQGNRSPSGFVKPTLISHELADFLRNRTVRRWRAPRLPVRLMLTFASINYRTRRMVAKSMRTKNLLPCLNLKKRMS